MKDIKQKVIHQWKTMRIIQKMGWMGFKNHYYGYRHFRQYESFTYLCYLRFPVTIIASFCDLFGSQEGRRRVLRWYDRFDGKMTDEAVERLREGLNN